jgi:hypothetical protein
VGSDQTSRATLHAIAELLLAGPQYRRSGTIRLRVRADGFATVAAPETRYSGCTVIHDGTQAPIGELTYAELGKELGLDAGAPEGLYSVGSGASLDETPALDGSAAADLIAALHRGDQGLRSFAPDLVPVLWPEHFDVAISIDEVNYGVSLGDAYLDEPYMYVGPYKPRTGSFWNAPFGAARPLAATVEEVAAFFAEGRQAAAED